MLNQKKQNESKMKTKTLLFTILMIVCCTITTIKKESFFSNSSILLTNIEALTQEEFDGIYIYNSELANRTLWITEYAFVEGMYVPVRVPYSIKCCVASNSYNRCEKSYQDSRCPMNP